MNFYNISGIPERIKNLLIRNIRNFRTLSNLYKYSDDSIKTYNKNRILGPRKYVCYAPFKSMYFTNNGNVQACCLNTKYVLGNISEQTIQEIWNGNNINLLREALSKNNLSIGCTPCRKRIESHNYYAAEAMKYDVFPLKNTHPVMLEFELSHACNLNCIMCMSKNGSSNDMYELNEKIYNDTFLSQLESYIPYLKKAKFIGGEPFYIPFYYKIWERIIKLNPACLILVQTNASILNEKIKTLLNTGKFRISISIDSFRKETYEMIRRNAHFENVMKNLRFFSEHAKKNNYQLSIAVCPMQQNWEELYEIVQKCNDLNAQIYFNTVVEPQDCTLKSVDIVVLSNVVNKLENFTLPTKKNIENYNKKHFQSFVNQLKAWLSEKIDTDKLMYQKSLYWEQQKNDIEKTPLEEHLQNISYHLSSFVDSDKGKILCKKKLQDYMSHIQKILFGLNDFPYLKHFLLYLKEFSPALICEVLDTDDESYIKAKIDEVKQKLISEISYKDV